jgi:hypothetical protein
MDATITKQYTCCIEGLPAPPAAVGAPPQNTHTRICIYHSLHEKPSFAAHWLACAGSGGGGDGDDDDDDNDDLRRP